MQAFRNEYLGVVLFRGQQGPNLHERRKHFGARRTKLERLDQLGQDFELAKVDWEAFDCVRQLSSFDESEKRIFFLKKNK